MSKTLAQIRAITRRFIDETDDTTPVTWTNAELNAYINDGQKFLFSEIVKTNPDYAVARSTASTVANQNGYTLPADMFGGKFRGMWAYSASTANRTEVQYKSNDTVMGLQHITGYPQYYAIIDGGIVLAPVPDGIYTLEIWYSASPTVLSTDADNCWFKDEEVEAVAAWAAIKALTRIGRDESKVSKILDIVLGQIKGNVTQDDNLSIDADPLDMS